MTEAMISSDMPTSGTVILPVRTLASASCSADKAPRNVAVDRLEIAERKRFEALVPAPGRLRELAAALRAAVDGMVQ